MAAEFTTDKFNRGIWNILDNENIPTQAAQDSNNWRSLEDSVEFSGGLTTLGTPSSTVDGSVSGLYFVNVNYKDLYSLNTNVTIKQTFGLLKRVGKKLYAWKDDAGTGNGTWFAIPIVGTSNTDLFQDGESVYMQKDNVEYQSLAGRYIYIMGNKSNIYKLDPYALNDSARAFVTRCYDPAINFLSNGILFDKSQATFWDRPQDATGIVRSKVDPQGANYTTTTQTISTTTLGANVSVINQRLSVCTSNEKLHVFAVKFTSPEGTFLDDTQGGFKNTATGASIPRYDPRDIAGLSPISASICYNTGLIQVAFHPAYVSGLTFEFQYENPTVGGVLDCTFSVPRLTGEAEIIRQDSGADRRLTVIPYRGVYYSIGKTVAYKFTVDNEANVNMNEIFARNLGIPNGNAVAATDLGIVYIDTSDIRFPRLKILKNLEYGGVIQPEEIAKHFRFSDYDYSLSYFEIFNNNILITARTLQAKIDNAGNDTILFYDLRNDAISKYSFPASVITSGGSQLFVGKSGIQDVGVLFRQYSNDGLQVPNYWTGKSEKYAKEQLKKLKWIRIKGRIDEQAKIKVYMTLDNGNRQLVGTINGNGTYTDQSGSYTIGGYEIGTQTIGGQQDVTNSLLGNTFMTELKLFLPEFRTRAVTFEAEGIGYASVNLLIDYGIIYTRNMLPQRYRSKQYVTLSGTPNQSTPPYTN